MNEHSSTADYDVVGRYNQNRVNGLTEELLDSVLEMAEIEKATTVCDAMGGDGNLSVRVHDYCKRKKIKAPHTTLIEISRVQTEFAKPNLPKDNSSVIWGDIIKFLNLKTGEALPEEVFDCVMVKSANHEIPKEDQLTLYRNIFRMLKPGGIYVNLGFLFDEFIERDEFIRIANVKDHLAGMEKAARKRYFMTRTELYDHLKDVNFSKVEAGAYFNYHIHSEVVASQYFKGPHELEYDLEHQAIQVKAIHLRRRGRIEFTDTASIMHLPGEVTKARKPLNTEDGDDLETLYQRVNNVNWNKATIESICSYIEPTNHVLDLGFGLGDLAYQLKDKDVTYMGVSVNSKSVKECQNYFAHRTSFKFTESIMEDLHFAEGSFDVVVLRDVLSTTHTQPTFILEKAYNALKPGGRIVILGALGQESLMAAHHVLSQELLEQGASEEDVQKVLQSRFGFQENVEDSLNYWSREGLVTLLESTGFTQTEILQKNEFKDVSHFIVSQKNCATKG